MPRPQRFWAPVRDLIEGFLGPLKLIVANRSLLVLLMRREFVSRTSGTVLGSAWLLVQPVLQLLGLWFFLTVVLRVRSPAQVPFTDYFLIGMVAWMLISEVLIRNLTVLVEFAPLYQRALFPLPVLPLLPLLMTGLIYGSVLVTLGGALGGWRGAVGSVVFLVLLMGFLVPFSYALATFGLFVREARQVVPFVLTLLMYLTPVMYMPEMVPQPLREWLLINPLADIMALIHALVQGMPCTPGNFWRPFGLSLLLWPIAWAVFRRSESHMREAL
jgi:lipopolysaccharide transport system permease protein